MPQSWQNCLFIEKVFYVNSPKWFSFTDCPLSWWKNLRKTQSWSLDISFHILRPRLDQYCPTGPKKFWKFHQSNFYHTVVPNIAAKFGKNSYSISWGIGLDNCVPKWSQNFLFGSQEVFSGNFFWMIFIYLFCPIMLKSLKNILTADFLQATIEQKKKKKQFSKN